MKPILVPTDFSEFADYATEAAIGIAQKTSKQVLLMHGINSGLDRRTIQSNEFEKIPELKKKISKAEEHLQQRIDLAAQYGVAADKKIIYLEEYKSLSHAIAEIPSLMIVMGSQGIGALRKIFAGSNTSKVLGSASQPVLVVKDRPALPCNYRTIVFASNLEEDTHDAFDLLLRFGKSVGAENFHLVEITTPQNFQPSHLVRSRMENYISRHDFHSIWLHNYNHYTVEAGIAEFADRVDADIIAIANHGRGDISSLFIESIPENLLKYSRYPILSIRI